MKFEYLALIGAALYLSNALGDIQKGLSWLTVGDICVALAIICAYISAFIHQLQHHKSALLKFAGMFASLGLVAYITNFV